MTWFRYGIWPPAARPVTRCARQRVTDEWMDMVMLRGTGEPATGLDSLLLIAPAEVLAFLLENVATVFRKAPEQFQRPPAAAP